MIYSKAQIPKGIYGRIYVRFKVRFKEHRDTSKEIVPKNLREIYNKISAGFSLGCAASLVGQKKS